MNRRRFLWERIAVPIVFVIMLLWPTVSLVLFGLSAVLSLALMFVEKDRARILFWSVIVLAIFALPLLLEPVLFVPLKAGWYCDWLWWWRIGDICVVAVVAFFLIYFWWAPSNLFFTFVREGSAKIVVRGDKFERVLIQWRGHVLSKEWDVIEESDKNREPWHPFGGLRFYGLWPIMDIYGYNFEWYGINGEGQLEKHPKEFIDYILLKDDVYGARVEKAEDQKLLPLDIVVALTVRVCNPYRALFNIQNWLETLINRIEPTIRDIATQKDYEEWIKVKGDMGQQIFRKAKKIREEELQARYGVEVRKVQVRDINPPGDFREKTLEPYFAELKKKAIVIEAEAEKARISTVFSQIKEFGDLGTLIRALEAAERSPLAASLQVQAIPGLQGIIQGAFGKPAEAVTKEDIVELRKMIEGLASKP